ncbi:unnamed protein product [Moneuplotes crassus]|uniref:Uncharacterized protein n=1 Tax=Euplotes crassus TaxID=5936 RepID=A0AAD1XZ78_EUPCR|nr:unnamed protein product [Moneuplotes crassus]
MNISRSEVANLYTNFFIGQRVDHSEKATLSGKRYTSRMLNLTHDKPLKSKTPDVLKSFSHRKSRYKQPQVKPNFLSLRAKLRCYSRVSHIQDWLESEHLALSKDDLKQATSSSVDNKIFKKIREITIYTKGLKKIIDFLKHIFDIIEAEIDQERNLDIFSPIYNLSKQVISSITQSVESLKFVSGEDKILFFKSRISKLSKELEKARAHKSPQNHSSPKFSCSAPLKSRLNSQSFSNGLETFSEYKNFERESNNLKYTSADECLIEIERSIEREEKISKLLSDFETSTDSDLKRKDDKEFKLKIIRNPVQYGTLEDGIEIMAKKTQLATAKALSKILPKKKLKEAAVQTTDKGLAERRLQNAKDQIEELRRVIYEYKKREKATNGEISQLTKDLEFSQKTRKEYRKRIDAQDRDKEKVTEHIKEFQEEINELNEANDTKYIIIGTLKSELKRAKGKVIETRKTYEQQIADFEDQLSKLSEQKDKDAKEIKRLNGYLEYTKAIFQIDSIEELELHLQQIIDLREELQAAKEEIKQLSATQIDLDKETVSRGNQAEQVTITEVAPHTLKDEESKHYDQSFNIEVRRNEEVPKSIVECEEKLSLHSNRKLRRSLNKSLGKSGFDQLRESAVKMKTESIWSGLDPSSEDIKMVKIESIIDEMSITKESKPPAGVKYEDQSPKGLINPIYIKGKMYPGIKGFKKNQLKKKMEPVSRKDTCMLNPILGTMERKYESPKRSQSTVATQTLPCRFMNLFNNSNAQVQVNLTDKGMEPIIDSLNQASLVKLKLEDSGTSFRSSRNTMMYSNSPYACPKSIAYLSSQLKSNRKKMTPIKKRAVVSNIKL